MDDFTSKVNRFKDVSNLSQLEIGSRLVALLEDIDKGQKIQLSSNEAFMAQLESKTSHDVPVISTIWLNSLINSELSMPNISFVKRVLEKLVLNNEESTLSTISNLIPYTKNDSISIKMYELT